MKRKTDRLEERLGDFGPLPRPINELAVERLLDRFGIALVCDYPQILFERRDQLLLPGWRYREIQQEYPRFFYARPQPTNTSPSATVEKGLFVRAEAGPSRGFFGRRSDAYRILDEIYAPARRETAGRRGGQGYGKNRENTYS